MEEHEPTEEIWRLLAHAEECFLHYPAAHRCLERAIACSGRRDKRDFKKLALYKEYAQQWKKLSLSSQELADLGNYLEDKKRSSLIERNFKWTKAWLAEKKRDANLSIEAFRERGAYDDLQVLENVVYP